MNRRKTGNDSSRPCERNILTGLLTLSLGLLLAGLPATQAQAKNTHSSLKLHSPHRSSAQHLHDGQAWALSKGDHLKLAARQTDEKEKSADSPKGSADEPQKEPESKKKSFLDKVFSKKNSTATGEKTDKSTGAGNAEKGKKSGKGDKAEKLEKNNKTGKKNESAPAAAKESPDKETDAATGAAPEKAPAATGNQAAEQAAAGAPVYQVDAALISVLKDVSKALKESEDVDKLEDAGQKQAVKMASDVLAAALDNPQLASDRIISGADKDRLQSAMTAESWDSGDIKLSADCHASVSALWAKKLNGLINICVAGNCLCSKESCKPGEFIVVITGKSAVDSGFDIQTQSNVSFWLGKLTGFNADTSTAGNPAEATKKTSQSLLLLKAPLTERSRKYLLSLSAWEEQQKLVAAKAEQERQRAESEAKALAEARAASEAEAQAKAAREAKAQMEAKSETAVKAGSQPAADLQAKATTETKTLAETKSGSNSKPDAGAIEEKAQGPAQSQGERDTTSSLSAKNPDREGSSSSVPASSSMANADGQLAEPSTQTPPEHAAQANQASVAFSTPPPDPAHSRTAWDSPSPPPSSRIPGSSATMVVPERAVAGQFITIAVINSNRTGEPFVELSFNGAALTTGQDGKVTYLVPEDAPPGPSLQVALTARPEFSPEPINVLQPLMTPTSTQVPRIDRVSPLVGSNGTLTVDGHSFDGIAERNRVIIDGMHDARVLVASPVQLKADLPSGIAPGQHSITVSSSALRSNPAQCEIVAVQIEPAGKDTEKEQLRKLIVRVVGTTCKVRLKLQNNSPDVIRLAKGNEVVVTTPGGPNNFVTLSAQRLSRGNFHIGTSMEPVPATLTNRTD